MSELITQIELLELGFEYNEFNNLDIFDDKGYLRKWQKLIENNYIDIGCNYQHELIGWAIKIKSNLIMFEDKKPTKPNVLKLIEIAKLIGELE